MKNLINIRENLSYTLKLDLKMKLTIYLFLFSLFQIYANTYSQNTKISLNLKDTSVENVIQEIESRTDFKVLYNSEDVDYKRKVTVIFKEVKIFKILDKLFADTKTDYKVVDKQIVLVSNQNKNASPQSGNNINKLQQKKGYVTGVVQDPNGPIAGATVVIKGASSGGTMTDFDGNFVLEIKQESVEIEVSYIGYATKTITAKINTTITVNLEEEASKLNEIVLLGYTSRKKGELTGSVTTISDDVIEKSSSKDVAKSLAGRASGLFVSDRGGYPGAGNGGGGNTDDDATTILVRGKATTGNNSPLILIDGIQAASFSFLAPQDIASLTILKDGAAAIYGSRAANGVILITTKRGQEGAPKISFTSSYSSSSFSRRPKLMSSSQYATYENEIAQRAGNALPYTSADIQNYANGSDPINFPNTNWVDVALAESAPEFRNSISISGGDDKVKYFVSGDSFDQKGLYKSGDLGFKQNQVRSNIDIKVFDELKIGVDLLGRFGDVNEPGVDDTNIYKAIYTNFPTQVGVYPNGLPGVGGENGANPLVMSSNDSGFINRKDNDLRGKFSYDLNLDKYISGLSVRGYAGIRKMSNDEKSWYTPWTVYNLDNGSGEYSEVTGFSQRGQSRILRESFWKYDETLLNSTVHYNKKIGKHKFSGFVGIESLTSKTKQFWAQRTGDFPSEESTEISLGGQDNQLTSGQSTEAARLDYFGSFSYNFDKKYFVDATVRRDGSGNFEEGKRYGTFPSLALAWSIGREDFMSDIDWLDELKIRGSVAKLGNDRIPAFQHVGGYLYGETAQNQVRPRYYTFGTSGRLQNSLGIANIPNTDVTWETAYMRNLGVNFTLFDKRLSGDVNYFYQKRTDILRGNEDAVPLFTGINATLLPDENIGETKSWGYELELAWADKIGEVGYNFGFNFSSAKNEIVNINESDNVISYQKQEGAPIDSYLVYPTNGLFQSQDQINNNPRIGDTTDGGGNTVINTKLGDPFYVDTNKDGVIDADDRVRVADSNIPQVQYGIFGGANYKNFEFNFLLQGQAQAKTLVFFDQIGAKPDFVYNQRWSPSNTSGWYPSSFGQNDQFSGNQSGDPANFEGADFYLRDASFLRLKEVELAYTFTKEMTKFGSVRLYARGYNLATFFSDIYDLGLDPEATSHNNFRGSTYPSLKTYTVGVNINF